MYNLIQQTQGYFSKILDDRPLETAQELVHLEMNQIADVHLDYRPEEFNLSGDFTLAEELTFRKQISEFRNCQQLNFKHQIRYRQWCCLQYRGILTQKMPLLSNDTGWQPILNYLENHYYLLKFNDSDTEKDGLKTLLISLSDLPKRYGGFLLELTNYGKMAQLLTAKKPNHSLSPQVSLVCDRRLPFPPQYYIGELCEKVDSLNFAMGLSRFDAVLLAENVNAKKGIINPLICSYWHPENESIKFIYLFDIADIHQENENYYVNYTIVLVNGESIKIKRKHILSTFPKQRADISRVVELEKDQATSQLDNLCYLVSGKRPIFHFSQYAFWMILRKYKYYHLNKSWRSWYSDLLDMGISVNKLEIMYVPPRNGFYYCHNNCREILLQDLFIHN